MPSFDFVCEKCQLINEISISIKNNPPTTIHCDECGGPAKRIYSPPEVIFKGSGWPGVECKHGEHYRESRNEVERDEARSDEQKIGEQESKEVMGIRRQGKEVSKEFQRRQPKKWERYKSNLKKGIGRNV